MTSDMVETLTQAHERMQRVRHQRLLDDEPVPVGEAREMSFDELSLAEYLDYCNAYPWQEKACAK